MNELTKNKDSNKHLGQGCGDDYWDDYQIEEWENDEGESYYSLEISIRKTSWMESDLESIKEKIKEIIDEYDN